MDASLQLFATAHGKGACSGIRGTVKRLAGKQGMNN
jgi:hypothetical protein